MVGTPRLRQLCHRLWHFCRRGKLGNQQLPNCYEAWVSGIGTTKPRRFRSLNAMC